MKRVVTNGEQVALIQDFAPELGTTQIVGFSQAEDIKVSEADWDRAKAAMRTHDISLDSRNNTLKMSRRKGAKK